MLDVDVKQVYVSPICEMAIGRYVAEMRRLGLLSGMSWESSIEYERIIKRLVRERLGGVHLRIW